MVSSYLTHLTPHHLCYRAGKRSMYKLEDYSGYGIYLCFAYLARYEVIIFERHIVTRGELSVRYNQASFFVKLSVSSLVLVMVYWLDDQVHLYIY